jgi:NTE family protein
VAMDATTGERVMFEVGSGVGLVDAVAASSAVPGIWPPVTIGGARFVDGGVYSACNADLAVGYDRVLVLAPMVDPALAAQVSAVEQSGRARVVSPDEDSLAAFSADALDPGVRAPSAEAGRRQGARVAASLEELWAI